MFQFHKGSINTSSSGVQQVYKRRFNSIKVRLIRRAIHGRQRERRFQFHKGSINTVQQARMPYVKKSFNSIKVRLIPATDAAKAGAMISFNSIKVRLIHAL